MTPSNEKAAGGGAVELKPCPFCACKNIDFKQGSTYRWSVAYCTDCGAQSGEVRVQTTGSGPQASQDDVADEWNTRTDAESALKLQADRIAQLEFEVSELQRGRSQDTDTICQLRIALDAPKKPQAGRIAELEGALESVASICDETRSARDLQPRMTEIRGLARFAIVRRLDAPSAAPAVPDSPVAKIIMADGEIIKAVTYMPGLPDGEHELFTAPPVAFAGQAEKFVREVVEFLSTLCKHSDAMVPIHGPRSDVANGHYEQARHLIARAALSKTA